MPVEPWGERTFCVVTGASRGIGRTISLEFGRRLGPGSALLLMARSQQGLEETRTQVLSANPAIRVELVPLDLSSAPDTTVQVFHTHLTAAIKGEAFPSAILVHNAGTTGGVERYCKDYNETDYQNYFQTNLLSTMSLTSAFLRIFPATAPTTTVINLTSLAAIQPFVTMGLYCTGKAAREMYFKVLAEENPSLRVLNYSPGPVDTDMFRSIAKDSVDPEVRKCFQDMADGKRGSRGVLDCDTTVKRLVAVLEKGGYKSGDHIDFFD